MKRFLLLSFAAVLLAFSIAVAEDLPGTSPAGGALVFTPEDSAAMDSPDAAPAEDNAGAQATPTPSTLTEGEIQFDFSEVDNPQATPVAIDPIDMPTPTPMPTPSYWYETYTNESLGISFNIPGTWLLNPATNQDTTIQFVEPKSEMMEPNGYQTRVTIERVNTGLAQNSDDARTRLESTLSELALTFTTFTPSDIASASMGGADGAYCYYRAEYNDGTTNYTVRGRIIIVAHGNALYQVRITTPSNWYSYYEYVFRNIRSSFEFLTS